MTVNVLDIGHALRVLEAVKECPDFLAKELARKTGLSSGTVSIHLKRLHQAGLISRTMRSGQILNRITDAGVEALTPAIAPKPAGPGRQRAARAEAAIRSTSLSKEDTL